MVAFPAGCSAPQRIRALSRRAQTMSTQPLGKPFSGRRCVDEIAATPGVWWVVMAKPSHETRLVHDLRGKGVDVFFPLIEFKYRVKRAVGGPAIIRRLRPYLPGGYIAIHGEDEARYQAARSEHKSQIIDVVNQRRLNLELAAIEIAATAGDELHTELVEGSRVRVKTGPFQGAEGMLIKRRPNGSNFLLYVEFLGQAGVPLEIDPINLEPV